MGSIQVGLLASLVVAIFPLAGQAEVREITNFADSDVQLLTECAKSQHGSNCTIYDVRKSRRKKIISFSHMVLERYRRPRLFRNTIYL